MKQILIIQLVCVALLFSCGKGDSTDIFFVDITNQNTGWYADYDYSIDIDRDGENDFLVNKQDLYDYALNDYIYSIEFTNQGGKDVEFVAYDDCMTFFNSQIDIDENNDFDASVTLANTYALSCNETQGFEHFIGFRIEIDGEWHYGWMELTYDVNGTTTLTFNGYAFHNKAGKAIWTGQEE